MGRPSFVASTSALGVPLESLTLPPSWPSYPAQALDLQVLMLPVLSLQSSTPFLFPCSPTALPVGSQFPFACAISQELRASPLPISDLS